ncbi:TPA: hypothetical protein ACMDPN_003464 [Vibrio cholerae]|uniref:hypothetical protein n=1 Tax=Vibrio cholerae TaxID=666 RepID=UPI001D6CDDCF|nr:hypothetical protein [Vibrio cholerae]EGQ8391421.1 hypothetical protein [Vibrio cholerae]EGS7961777.1 hypothetical protein [Vibrio cholerae]EKF9179508.1 hypothetical protein [Vibrio cholerae]EKF9817656.1 hypothetical protein [Vibrio cholerae]MDV2391160.1 hypothetical protein [Vibrio cholerae]
MKSRLYCQLIISLLLTVILLAVVIYIVDNNRFPSTLEELQAVNMSLLWDYYEKHIRGNLFAGLIAVGGFLMTGKTFILVTMKQNVFDDAEYIKNYKKLVKFDQSLKRYAPLIQLKDILYVSVYMTIIAAIVQLTIGLIPHWSMALFSLFVAILSIVLVIDSLNLIKRNLDYWLNDREDS